ncbi:MAG: lysylphosphatidylglycerol synthase transmembrane domain-containing protein [Candidatus Saccharibacteria bacterium]|nr:lysylphosphatidylglycerol synthase transmembrane domain-containing protein [Candidatus Saccharibacteria bacterium]
MREVKRRLNWRIVLTVITFIALALAVYALREQISETITNLRNANLLWIGALVPLAITNHYSQGRMYQSVFRIFGERFRIKAMFRLSLELNFVNNVFPSGGVSGFSYLGLRMKSERVTSGKTTLVQLMRFVLLFIAFQVLLGIGLLLLALGGDANDFVILVSGSLATLLLVGTAVVAYIIGSKKRINGFFTALTKFLNRAIHFVRPKHPETINVDRVKGMFTELHENYMKIRKDFTQLKKPLLFALLANLAEVSAIMSVFMAFGSFINPGAVIIAYAVANFAGIISVLPGGVGIYEALMTGVFAASGVPAALSLPVVLAFRVVSMGIQLPVGYFFYQKNLQEQANNTTT